MSQILNRIRDVDANNSEAVKECLSVFFQNLPKHTDALPVQWLRTLENVINRFSKFCMFHRGTIESYLMHFLDSKNYFLVIEVAKCLHALQQVRPSQEKTATPKSSWREQVSLLCNTVHTLLETIFTSSVDIFKNGRIYERQETEGDSPTTPVSLALSTITEIHGKAQDYNADQKIKLLCLRLRNILIFIQAMLVEIYPVAKPVRPQTILDVIVRTLAVSSVPKHSSIQASECDIANLKIEALRCLDALIICLGHNLIPYSPLVFRIAMQTLRWSGENSTDEKRKVRCQAYKSLSIWLTTLHCHKPESTRRDGNGKCWEDELVTHILGDITPAKHVVQLTMSSQPTKNLSKKAKRKLANAMLLESNMASQMPGEKIKSPISEEMADDVAIAALECAETFLIVSGIFLKPTTHKILQERLVRECYQGDRYGSRRMLQLIRALEASRKSVPPGLPPPTQYCLQLYSTLVNSVHREISHLTSQALLDIKLHLHCSPPSLNFNIEVVQDSQKEKETKKVVSERNRAALESLLGSSKLTADGNNDEIITILDEPLNKKPRIEEVDKISVSSQSSLEVCVDSEEENEENSIEEIAMDVIVENEITTKDKEIEQNAEDDQVGKNDIELSSKIQTSSIKNIHEVVTQLPINNSGDTIDGQESPHSIEISYDYPSTGKSKVTVLDKMEDDNLPSTNETDDIQINCGQNLKSSQEVTNNSQKKFETLDGKDVQPKVNGFDDQSLKEDIHTSDTNSKDDKNNDELNKTEKISDGITVEDMLADFVDEVVDENIVKDSAIVSSN